MTGPRRLEIPAQRIVRWCAGFEERHGVTAWSAEAERYLLRAHDGSEAALSGWREPGSAAVPPLDLSGWAAAPSVFGLVLVRRGGYTVGVVQDGVLAQHYAGTRYVQSRTAAGGWSQQRYARRRGNQADALVNAVADRAAAMWSEHNLGGVVIGGDKALAASVLNELVLPESVTDTQRQFYDIPDPRHAVLKKVVDRSLRVSVDITETDLPS
ncbi:hypothetical protein K0651_09095 [Ornithinimicrobium sp. Arc0846-15]|nr:hypothetical protein [Ornithinimicrobium laminariae]